MLQNTKYTFLHNWFQKFLLHLSEVEVEFIHSVLLRW